MVLRLAIGCGAIVLLLQLGDCGTGHDHLCAMGLKLIISVKTVGCAVTMDTLEPRIFRIFCCNVGAAMYFVLTSAQENQTKN